MKEKRPLLITAALPYANGPLHIGHIAGAYLPADIFARYNRSIGEKVVFVCGSDEHGAAITLRAKKEGTTPQQIVNRYHREIKSAFNDFGMSFDVYHRTSDPLHHKTAQEFFTKLNDSGVFEIKESEQFYDAKHQQFLADRYIMGTCPKCAYEAAYGDQCEKCGSSLSPNELINPKSTLSGESPSLKTTKHWYLPMDKYQNWLKEWILEGKKGKWKTNVYGQCKSWLESGLGARAMTRDLAWGVKVPLADASGKVLYVWLDAPIGYISATKAWAQQAGEDWREYWQNERTRLIHFIGKDNIVFHCLIFPIILKAHGDYILPENVPANEFLNLEGGKISTSRGHAVWLGEYLKDFPEKQDVLRYVLCSIAPEAKDSEFTWDDFLARNNNELVAILGNFVNRVMVLMHKYYGGVVPVVKVQDNYFKEDIFPEIEKEIENIGRSIEVYKFRDAQNAMMNVARLGNKYLAETEPWKKIKTDENLTANIMVNALQVVAKLAVICEPFLPFSSVKLFDMLQAEKVNWQGLSSFEIPSGHQLGASVLLFEKLEQESIATQKEKLNKTIMEEPKKAEGKEEISFEDFTKMDLRIGTILEAKKVEGADRLLHLKVDIGIEVRDIVSGIAEHYNSDQIVGKKVTVLCNLSPRKIRGIESKGMILMAESDKKLSFISPLEHFVESGSGIS